MARYWPKLVGVLFGLVVMLSAYWAKGVDDRLNVVDSIFERLGRIEAKLDQALGTK